MGAAAGRGSDNAVEANLLLLQTRPDEQAVIGGLLLSLSRRTQGVKPCVESSPEPLEGVTR